MAGGRWGWGEQLHLWARQFTSHQMLAVHLLGVSEALGMQLELRWPLLLSSSLAESKWSLFPLQLNRQIRGPRGSQHSLCSKATPPPT